MEFNKFINADCLDYMKSLPDKSIDLVWTSPPYNLGNAKKGSFYGGKGDRIEYNSHNDNMNYQDYKEWQHNILKECFRIIKNTGAIFYNHKTRIVNGVFQDRRDLIPFDIRQEIIWDRCGMVNFSGTFYAPNTERIFIIAKEDWKPIKKYLGLGEVWRFPPELNTEHPAPFPLGLSEQVINSASNENDLILDCFSGSGTTAIACHNLNRRFICIEKDKEYFDKSVERYNKHIQQIKMFA